MALTGAKWSKLPPGPSYDLTPLAQRGVVWVASSRNDIYGLHRAKNTSEAGWNGYSLSTSGFGVKYSATASAGQTFGTIQPLSSSAAASFLVVAKPSSESTVRAAFSQRTGTGNAPQYSVLFNSNINVGVNTGSVVFLGRDNAANNRGLQADSQFDGSEHVWCGSINTGTQYIFRDGVSQSLATNTALSGTMTDSAQQLRIGNFADYTTTGNQTTAPLLLVVSWPFDIGKEWAQRLSVDPFGLIFRRKQIATVFSGFAANADVFQGQACL